MRGTIFKNHKPPLITASRLQGILEARLSLNHLSTSIDTLVSPPELQGHEKGDHDNQAVGDHASNDTWGVSWRILLSENGRSDDTTDATEADESSRAKSTLPLSTDVVGLVSQDGWDVGVGTDGGQEDTKVASTVVFGECQDWEAGKAEEGVEDDG